MRIYNILNINKIKSLRWYALVRVQKNISSISAMSLFFFKKMITFVGFCHLL